MESKRNINKSQAELIKLNGSFQLQISEREPFPPTQSTFMFDREIDVDRTDRFDSRTTSLN